MGKVISCNSCDYESPEEMWDDEVRDYMWWYYCNLAKGKRIIRDEGESYPEWCPLLKENEQCRVQ